MPLSPKSLGSASFAANPKICKGNHDLPPERVQELKRAGIIEPDRRLNWGSSAIFSGNRFFARTQWGVYCMGDPKAEWK
jgi:hypothetical protein